MMRTRAQRRMVNEVHHKLDDIKMVGKTTTTANAEVTKRGALGDIGNKFLGQTSQAADKKAVFKDVKPRVDTRWKKSSIVPKESVAIKKPATVKEPIKVTVKSKTIVTRQISKPDLVQIKKERVIKPSASVIETSTVFTDVLQTKKDAKPSVSVLERAAGFLEHPVLQIKSLKPSTFIKIKKEDEQKIFESHSQKLLSQIDNIDEKDRSNPQLLSQYVNDIYSYLYKLEDCFPIRENYLSKQIDVTPKMRSVLLDWINEVHFQFTLENETYHMAVSMLDRYLQNVSTTSRKQLQLVGVTALFLASKYEELMPPDISDFVYVTDDTYTKGQILQMEKQIFKALEFHLGKPLPIHFLRRFAKAAGHLGDQQYILAKYLVELASIDYGMAHYKPSQIAASSLCLALYTLNKLNNENELSCLNDLWTPTLEYYSRYSKTDLMPIMRKLAQLAKGARDAKLKAVYTKYSNSQFKFVSAIPELTGAKIDNIINS